MKPPAFQFYADDFVAGTVEMTAHEIGAYILLLCYEWSKGFVPDNDDAIRRICRESHSFDLTNIRCKFVSRRGKLFNTRLERERRKQNEFRANRSESGKKGAETRWLGHSSANGSAKQQPMAKDGSPSPSPSPNKEEGAASPQSASEKHPETPIREFSEKLRTARVLNRWGVWMNARRGFKKPKSGWAFLFNEQIEWLEKFSEPVVFEMLSTSIRNGWQGLFEPKQKPKASNPDSVGGQF